MWNGVDEKWQYRLLSNNIVLSIILSSLLSQDTSAAQYTLALVFFIYVFPSLPHMKMISTADRHDSKVALSTPKCG
jgi:hypothetical protein